MDAVLFFGDPYQHHMYSRRAYDEIGGYDESLKYEDLDFVLRFVKQQRLSAVLHPIKRYRKWRNGEQTPGLTSADIERSHVYHKNIDGQRGITLLACQLKACSESNNVCSLLLRVLAKLHLLVLTVSIAGQ